MNITRSGQMNFLRTGWHGPTTGSAPVISVAEKTIGSSHWVLEYGAYAHQPELIGALEELAARSGGANPFFEPEFLSASVDRIDEAEKKLIVLWERIGEASIARLAFPVIEDKVGLPGRRVLRAWSNPYAPLSTPLVDMDEAEEVCLRFARLLNRLEPLLRLPLVFADIATGDPAAVAFIKALKDEGFVVQTAKVGSRSYLPPSGGLPVEKHLPILSNTKRRKELARQLRKLSELGEIAFEKADDFEHIIVRFEEFLLLETRGWKGRKGTSIHILRKTASFARQAVAALGDRGRAAIYSLRMDGRSIASLIMLRSGNRYFPWKIAFDEHYHSYSPGSHLIIHASADILETPDFAGADSLAQEQSWIDRLWPDRMAIETLVIAPPGGGSALLVDSAAKSIARREKLKHLVHRLLRRRSPAS